MPNLVPKLVHNFMAIVCLWRQIGDKIDTQISWPWKHFFASKIVLRVIVCCLRGVGSMSSSRRIPRFIVLFYSGHRRLFLASLSAYVVVASLLYLRVVGSSFRRLRYILGKVLDVWRHNIYCTDFTCISYTFPFLLGTLLHRYPVTLLPCYSVIWLPCYSVTLLLCNLVTPLPGYYNTLLLCNLVTPLPCYSVTLSLCYLLPCCLVTLLPILVTLLPCFPITLLLCYLVALSPCYPVTLLPFALLLCPLVTLSLCYPLPC